MFVKCCQCHDRFETETNEDFCSVECQEEYGGGCAFCDNSPMLNACICIECLNSGLMDQYNEIKYGKDAIA